MDALYVSLKSTIVAPNNPVGTPCNSYDAFRQGFNVFYVYSPLQRWRTNWWVVWLTSDACFYTFYTNKVLLIRDPRLGFQAIDLLPNGCVAFPLFFKIKNWTTKLMLQLLSHLHNFPLHVWREVIMSLWVSPLIVWLSPARLQQLDIYCMQYWVGRSLAHLDFLGVPLDCCWGKPLSPGNLKENI